MSNPRLDGRRLALVPLAPEHAAAIRAIRATPAVSARWPDSPGFPLTDGDDARRYVVLVGDDPAPRGLIQFGEEDDPEYRHANIDVFLDPAVHGHGYAREAIAVLAAYLIDARGHHRITIDPAADNAPAIRCYTAVGFRPVGIMRRYERGADGTFHDGLLMDMLADELVRVPGAD